ncbi:hypothetical protein Misp01_71080 [Microtetraspora sp. NBRC 13810]|nr:hypothetical protein Misp01_71080 [Microtetraspora sp. NBRC 13810]
MSRVLWDRMASADITEIGDRAVIGRLFKRAEEELCFPPRKECADEGWVPGREGVLAWRRPAASASGDADVHDEASDYYLLYRTPTDREYRDANTHAAFRVMRVLHVSDFTSLST